MCKVDRPTSLLSAVVLDGIPLFTPRVLFLSGCANLNGPFHSLGYHIYWPASISRIHIAFST